MREYFMVLVQHHFSEKEFATAYTTPEIFDAAIELVLGGYYRGNGVVRDIELEDELPYTMLVRHDDSLHPAFYAMYTAMSLILRVVADKELASEVGKTDVSTLLSSVIYGQEGGAGMVLDRADFMIRQDSSVFGVSCYVGNVNIYRTYQQLYSLPLDKQAQIFKLMLNKKAAMEFLDALAPLGFDAKKVYKGYSKGDEVATRSAIALSLQGFITSMAAARANSDSQPLIDITLVGLAVNRKSYQKHKRLLYSGFKKCWRKLIQEEMLNLPKAKSGFNKSGVKHSLEVQNSAYNKFVGSAAKGIYADEDIDYPKLVELLSIQKSSPIFKYLEKMFIN